VPRDNRVIAIVHSNVPASAPPDEQDTLIVARQVQSVLREAGRKAVCIPYQPNRLAAELKAVKADLIFNLVESIDGRGDATDQATDLFTRLGYAFTGAGSKGLRATADKFASRDILHRHRLHVPDFMDEAAILSADSLPYPFILKSRYEEGSFGIFADSIAHTADDLRRVLAARKAAYGGEWFAEQFIEGREFHVPLLGNEKTPRILPVAEISYDAFPSGMPRIIDYAAKWNAESFQYNNTPYLFSTADADLQARLEKASMACWKAFKLGGSARIDFRVTSGGTPYVLDINANPCLAPQCILFASAARAGMTYSNIIDSLLSNSLPVKRKEPVHA
jgi:D-alanine-D-alanine ligase